MGDMTTIARPTVTAQPASISRRWWGAGVAVAAVGWGAQQFAPLLLMYESRLHLSSTTVQAIFGMYVLGLIPGMLLGGPVSDRYGRRRVMAPTLAVSATATLLLVADRPGWLFAGRLVAGVASGAAFSSGAAWIKELSAAGHGPRRLTVAMCVGFGLGPLVAGVLAQWAPAPTTLPYLPHLALTALALPLALATPETHTPTSAGWRSPGALQPRFLLVAVPLGPWIFLSASVGLAYLPGLVAAHVAGHALIFSAVITLLCATAGILVQPLARRLARGPLLVTALSIVIAGLLIAAAVAATRSPALVVAAALVLGAGYGSCQVCGLLEVQRLARPERLAGLTAIYQAVSYLGYAAPFPLAAATDRGVPPTALMLGVAALAAFTLGWTTYWNIRR
jgi:hypothetical protein